jgi:hypothetical protein
VSDADEPWLRLQITPEPTPEEREALVAALSVYLANQPRNAPDEEAAVPSSRWLVAGRRAAVRGLKGGSPMGWGRERDGWQ